MELDSLIRDVIISPNARSPRIVVVKFPRGNSPIVRDCTLNFYDASRPKIGPREFFLSCPNDLDRALRRARQTGRFDGCVSRVLSAVTGARVRHLHTDVFFGNVESSGQFRTYAKRALRTR